MNRVISLLMVTLVFSLALFPFINSQASNAMASKVSKTMAVKRFDANTAVSIVEWIGTKPTGQHNGTIGLIEGYVTVENNRITGGEFVIDMNSIKVLDITNATMNANLRNHLMSADFFEVDKYPFSRFVITSVAGSDKGSFLVTGNLTMKDITKSITFVAAINVTESGVSASTSNFFINRSDWNVRYGSKRFFSNLKDNFVADDISLKINLSAGN